MAGSVNATGTAIGFDGERVAGPRLGLVDESGTWTVAGASWSDGRTWPDRDTPTFLDGTGPQPVELGVVAAAPRRDAPGRGVAVWLPCLARS